MQHKSLGFMQLAIICGFSFYYAWYLISFFALFVSPPAIATFVEVHVGQVVFFLSYAVRVDWSGNKVPKSADALLQPKYNYYLILTYSTAEKSILEFTPSINAYTPLNFHKATLGKKTVLYAVENGSSFGWATEKILLSVFDPATFSGLAQEIILYSQSFYAAGVEDIEFCKDFEFDGNALHFWGTDFDFDAGKYIRGYDKVYRF